MAAHISDEPAETANEQFEAGGTGSASDIRLIMAPLMLTLFISTLDQTIVATALNDISRSLGSPGHASWVATAYLLTSAVSTLIFGKLGDIYGRKPIFQFSVAIFVIGSALCSFAPNMLSLIIFRGLQGIGGGALNSLVMAIIGDLVPARERPRYQAVLGIVPAIAIVLGPVLGGWIVDQLSWPWIFLINVPLGLVAFVLIAMRLHLPVRHSDHRIDFFGGVLAIVFTSAALYLAVSGGQAYPWNSWQVMALAALSIVALITYILVERRAIEPLTPLELFGNGVFTIASALFFLATAALFVGMLFAPLMLQTVYGLSALAAGTCTVPLLLGLIAAAIMTGGVISKTGRYKIFPVIGALLGFAGFLALSRVSLTTPVWQISCILAVIGVGIGFFMQVVILAGQNAVDAKHLGVATGALNFFKTLGGAAGAAIFGALLTASLPASPTMVEQTLMAFQSVYIWGVPLMGFAFFLALMLEEKPLSEEIKEIAEGTLEAPEY
ncbi:MAG: MFS transporter [Rhizobiaceae bacterium]|nr:MFS transporter [Rhizobiaceae bacterium]